LRRAPAHRAATGHAGPGRVRNDHVHPVLARVIDPAHRRQPPRGHDRARRARRSRLGLLRILHADDGDMPGRAAADAAAGAAAAKVRGAGPCRRSFKGLMRFGLIGYGLFGRHHARAIAQAPGATLAAIACRSRETADSARRDWPDASVDLDYQALLARRDVDAVDIVVPNDLHEEIGVAAPEAGKDVL